MSKKILCTVGTRPEAIKMAPVIQALQKSDFDCRVLATGQHRQMLDQVLGLFGITPDIDLDIMQPNQSLSELTGRLLLKLPEVLEQEKPDAVLAQGDTTTVFATALACFYHGIPFGHVEAGLRTHDIRNPFPEEMNRVVVGHFARWHFAPTEFAAQKLRDENYSDDQIFVVGNTVIDALLGVSEKQGVYQHSMSMDKRQILVTLHRRENFGRPLSRICDAILNIASNHPDVQFVVPVHHNPNVRGTINEFLGNHAQITLCEPFNYEEFVGVMKRSYLIMSDSGGIQEEAPTLGIPVLVLRENTERPEAIDSGVAILVGTQTSDIENAANDLLVDKNLYEKIAQTNSPFGDGHAAQYIVKQLVSDLL